VVPMSQLLVVCFIIYIPKTFYAWFVSEHRLQRKVSRNKDFVEVNIEKIDIPAGLFK
jgi:hypothetical protein